MKESSENQCLAKDTLTLEQEDPGMKHLNTSRQIGRYVESRYEPNVSAHIDIK